jgi:hypothetical protein
MERRRNKRKNKDECDQTATKDNEKRTIKLKRGKIMKE